VLKGFSPLSHQVTATLQNGANLQPFSVSILGFALQFNPSNILFGAQRGSIRQHLAKAMLLTMVLGLSACGGGGGGGSSGTGSSITTGSGSTTTQTLSVTVSGTGTVTSSTGGISCSSSTCSASITTGTTVTLTATAGSSYTFAGWSGSCSGTSSTCSVTMSAAKSATATFSAVSSNYTLTVTPAGTGSGTVTSSTGGISCGSTCSASIASGTSVTLTAAATSGSSFTGWSGACSGTSTTCTLTMSAARNVTATFDTTITSSSCSSSGATTLATIVTNSSGTTTTNTQLTSSCPSDTAYGSVNGKCYGNYAVQTNSYNSPPASSTFSMWSQSASCWGINSLTTGTPSNYYFWNAPEATRGWSYGYNGLLSTAGGLQVSSLNSSYSSSAPCPASGGSAASVCVKWTMSVPGVASSTTTNDASNTYTVWNALLDVYFHSAIKPSNTTDTSFDLQIYQMVMDYQAGGNPNWATYLIGTWSKKTINGITYMVSVNMQDPGTYGSGTKAWVGSGGTQNMVSMFVLPTYPTSASGSKSYLWGSSSVTHDLGGIISWLSQTQTISGVTGIFDDSGNRLWDNVGNKSVSTALISPSLYLTGMNAGYEVVDVTTAGRAYSNNSLFNTTNYWVALPGETTGN
jgi:uncharacterized repeat protein (TIGR02543 family)